MKSTCKVGQFAISNSKFTKVDIPGYKKIYNISLIM